MELVTNCHEQFDSDVLLQGCGWLQRNLPLASHSFHAMHSVHYVSIYSIYLYTYIRGRLVEKCPEWSEEERSEKKRSIATFRGSLECHFLVSIFGGSLARNAFWRDSRSATCDVFPYKVHNPQARQASSVNRRVATSDDFILGDLWVAKTRKSGVFSTPRFPLQRKKELKNLRLSWLFSDNL